MSAWWALIFEHCKCRLVSRQTIANPNIVITCKPQPTNRAPIKLQINRQKALSSNHLASVNESSIRVYVSIGVYCQGIVGMMCGKSKIHWFWVFIMSIDVLGCCTLWFYQIAGGKVLSTLELWISLWELNAIVLWLAKVITIHNPSSQKVLLADTIVRF